MARINVPRQRLANQLIAHPISDRPADVVKWLGAVQAQDYLGSLWAVALRTKNRTERDVEQALADRTIIRTWPMRGTLHFVAPDDVRWMLDLLAPRVMAASATRDKQLELDGITFTRSRNAVERALMGGNALGRVDLYRVLESARISTAGQRGIHILGRLAQQGVICFGARVGKQQTFVLLDEWAPGSKRLDRDAALAELADRYFTGHGPATVQDFGWWSGLSASDARKGLDLARAKLVHAVLHEQEYWLTPTRAAVDMKKRTAFLLPGFDEYLVGYRDRRAVVDPLHVKQTNAGGGMLNPTFVLNGQIVGTWKRTLQRDTVIVKPAWFTPPTESKQRALAHAAEHYGDFLGLKAVIG